MDRILRFLLSSTQSTTLLMHYNMSYIGYYSILRVYWSRFTSSLRCTFVPAAHLNVRHTFYPIFSICNILCFGHFWRQFRFGVFARASHEKTMFNACKFDVYELHLVRRTYTQSLVHYRSLNHDEHQPFFQNL